MNPYNPLLAAKELAQKKAYTDSVHERIHSPTLEKSGLRTLLSHQVEITRDLEAHIDAQQATHDQFRQAVADELRKLRALTVELCIHGGHIQPEEIDEIAARLQVDL